MLLTASCYAHKNPQKHDVSFYFQNFLHIAQRSEPFIEVQYLAAPRLLLKPTDDPGKPEFLFAIDHLNGSFDSPAENPR
jgi:hypothetical protein